MKNQNQNVSLGNLKLEPISSSQLKEFKQNMTSITIPKIKEDVKRNGRNVSIARDKIAYNN